MELIHSKGPYASNYALLHQKQITNNKVIKMLLSKYNNVIWIRNANENLNKNSKYVKTDLDFLSDNLDKKKDYKILITTDGIRSVPSTYCNKTVHRILNCKYIKLWYTQNYDKSIIHDKLRHFPIGFDLHTKKWYINNSRSKKIEYMIKLRLYHDKKRIKFNNIFCDAHLTYSHNDRRVMYKKLKNNKKILFLKNKIPIEKISELYNNYRFAISPRGKGLDCHRTWELFLAGCIVIVKKSSLDDMYKDNQLPVVIINDWNELNTNLDEKLKKWYDKYHELTKPSVIIPKLKFNYWIKDIV